MKRALPWIVVLGILAIIVLWVANAYNSFVAAEEEVESAWSQVENQYQRRADLVPNLVATVKGYAAHEQETLEGVIEARAKATQITIDPEHATAEQLAAFQAAQGELSQALGRLLAIAENYPDLKAMYDPEDGNTETLYFKDATAIFYSFTEAPKTVTF